MQSTVSQNRDLYLGGSDIPALLGISKYKTRWQLLKEKAQIVPVVGAFANPAITYGNTMEPKIRDYLNTGRAIECKYNEWKFEKPLKNTTLQARGHLDGFDPVNKICLEIKTTSEYRGDDVRNYPDYLYQMLFYMIMPRPALFGGVLAVYMRPDDYNEVFDETRLHVFKFKREEMKPEIKHLKAEIARFIEDLNNLIANPEQCELDMLNAEIAGTSERVLAFERVIAELKEKEQQYKELKEQLAEQMETFGVKTFEAGGYQITLVEGSPESVETVKTCDFDTLELFYPDAAAECIQQTEKKKAGRKTSVRITKKKGAQ